MVMTAILSVVARAPRSSRISRKRGIGFGFADPAKALKRGGYQQQVKEQTGAKRDEQEDAETTELAIRRHDRTKLPENRRAHKSFSRGASPL